MTRRLDGCGSAAGFNEYKIPYVTELSRHYDPYDSYGTQIACKKSNIPVVYGYDNNVNLGQIFVRDTNNSYAMWANSGLVVQNHRYDKDWEGRGEYADVFNEIDPGVGRPSYLSFNTIYNSRYPEQETRCWRSARLCMCVRNATIKKPASGIGRVFDFSNAKIEWFQAVRSQGNYLPTQSRPFSFPAGRDFVSRPNFKSYKYTNGNPLIPVFANDGARFGVCSLLTTEDAFGYAMSGTDYWGILYADPEGGALELTPADVRGNYCGSVGKKCVQSDSGEYECKGTAGDYINQFSYYSFDYTGGHHLNYFSKFTNDELIKLYYASYRISGVFYRFSGIKKCIKQREEEHAPCENCKTVYFDTEYDFSDGYLFWGNLKSRDFADHIKATLEDFDLMSTTAFFNYSGYDDRNRHGRPPILNTAFDFVAVFDVFRTVTFNKPGRPAVNPEGHAHQVCTITFGETPYLCTDLKFFHATQIVPVQAKSSGQNNQQQNGGNSAS